MIQYVINDFYYDFNILYFNIFHLHREDGPCGIKRANSRYKEYRMIDDKSKFKIDLCARKMQQHNHNKSYNKDII